MLSHCDSNRTSTPTETVVASSISTPKLGGAEQPFITIHHIHHTLRFCESVALRADANPIPVADALFQHLPVFGYLDVPLGTDQHQGAVILKVAVPFDRLLVGPGR